jgi:cation transport ATPase
LRLLDKLCQITRKKLGQIIRKVTKKIVTLRDFFLEDLLFRLSGISGDDQLPASAGDLECMMRIDHCYAATFRFRDAPRAESRSFVKHLGPKHQFGRVMIVSGDRESEVRYLADQVGIYGDPCPKESRRKAGHRPPRDG